MFENNLLAGVSGQGGGYFIENSLRFNDDDSAYLSRTPSVAGNRKTWTWSAWVKRGNIGTRQAPFTANSGTAGHTFEINDTNTLWFFDTGAGASVSVRTAPVFRDVSGWYHIILVADTTQATASNRIKFYVNGTLITNYAVTTYPSLNADLEINNNIAHNIGNRPLNTFYFDGYLAEVNFIDGQALTADDFGEIDAITGEWSPIEYAGTYGTNGFYLPFDGNANDSSGNGNNWTENNLASTDYMIDTPLNNFDVLNNLLPGTAVTFREGNLVWTATSGNTKPSHGSMVMSSGKWYVEHLGITNGSIGFTGVVTPSGTSASYERAIVYWGNGKIYLNESVLSYTSGISGTAIVGLAYDVDTGDLEIYVNGITRGVYQTGFTGPKVFYFTDGSSAATYVAAVNFGQDSSFAGNKTRQGNTDANGKGDFYYAPPAGYLALCTDNLPEPAIVQPETQFKTVLYTGTGVSKSITGVGFQPDFVWIKGRSDANDYHFLFDSVRGPDKVLKSNFTDAEYDAGGNGYFPSFDSDGFSLVGNQLVNGTSQTYVAWCWKAGGTAVSNTDGSITSQVSANVDAGFSIVSYTATNNSSNVGHGLSQAPELIIFKSRTSTSSWMVYTTTIDGTYDYLFLNLTNAKGDSVLTAPSSSVMYVNNTEAAGTNVGSDNYIAYAFHSVEGFSKFGSYFGNGSADGSFVYTGFKPAFVMMKDVNNANSWIMMDNMRTAEYNPQDGWLVAHSSTSEYNVSSSDSRIDLLSNGFKLRNSNAGNNGSGRNYLYMAFAEHPFNYATGR